jgi:hypothetical protein
LPGEPEEGTIPIMIVAGKSLLSIVDRSAGAERGRAA